MKPDKMVAVELRGDRVAPLDEYLSKANLRETVKCYYGVDQADAARLGEIIEQEFEGPLDLVIDDASHFYALSKRSFEVLFPLLKPQGLYLLEDWGWEHNIANTLASLWEGQGAPQAVSKPPPVTESIIRLVHERLRPREREFGRRLVRLLHNVNHDSGEDAAAQGTANEDDAATWTPLSQLVLELVLLRASSPGLIQEIQVGRNVVAVRRGNQPLDPDNFEVCPDLLNVFGQLR